MKKQNPGMWWWIVQLLQAALGQMQPPAKHGDIPCPLCPPQCCSQRGSAAGLQPGGTEHPCAQRLQPH